MVIVVPDDYPTIQSAIDVAKEGATILVKPGTYYEHITINKPLKLVAEDGKAIIEGGGSGHTVIVTTNNATLVGFTLKGANAPWAGLHVYYSFFNTFLNNTIVDNYYGIHIYDSGRNVFRENNLARNRYNLRVWGLVLSHFLQDIDASNTVNGRPIYYWISQRYKKIPPDAGYVAIINSTGVSLANLVLTNNYQGVLLAYSRECSIRNTTISKNGLGIQLLSSHDNAIRVNQIYENELSGVYLDFSRNNTICENIISNNTWNGILLSFSPIFASKSIHNVISGNEITGNGQGVYFASSNNNTVRGNAILMNRHEGLYLGSSEANPIYGNTIAKNGHGVWLENSKGNLFYHNTFEENEVQVGSYTTLAPENFWYSDVLKGGNYWSDYNGTDLRSGPFQNVTGSDGIGDDPYVIDDRNMDYYPLMNPCVPLFGDLSYDGMINQEDLSLLGDAFGSFPGNLRWSRIADLTGNDIVDGDDLFLVARNFGKIWSSQVGG